MEICAAMLYGQETVARRHVQAALGHPKLTAHVHCTLTAVFGRI